MRVFQHGKAHVGDVIHFKPSILQSQNVCTHTFAPKGVVTEVTYKGYHPTYTLQLAPLVAVTVTSEDCTKLVRHCGNTQYGRAMWMEEHWSEVVAEAKRWMDNQEAWRREWWCVFREEMRDACLCLLMIGIIMGSAFMMLNMPADVMSYIMRLLP